MVVLTYTCILKASVVAIALYWKMHNGIPEYVIISHDKFFRYILHDELHVPYSDGMPWIFKTYVSCNLLILLLPQTLFIFIFVYTCKCKYYKLKELHSNHSECNCWVYYDQVHKSFYYIHFLSSSWFTNFTLINKIPPCIKQIHIPPYTVISPLQWGSNITQSHVDYRTLHTYIEI
jgi:hypothetical protein